MARTLKYTDEVEVRFTGRDFWITRLALDELMATSTREKHVYPDIRAAQAKLLEVHEPGGSDCHCDAEKVDA